MKKGKYLIAGLVLMLFIGTSVCALAADKIGFINLREIMRDSAAGKKAGEDFKKLYEKKNEAIKTAENELKKMKEDLDKQAAVLTPSARKDKESAYQKKMRDYQLLVDDTNKELKEKDEEVGKKIIPEIMKAVRSVAEREKLTMVVDIMSVAYYAKEQDISKKVIEEYNKQSTKK